MVAAPSVDVVLLRLDSTLSDIDEVTIQAEKRKNIRRYELVEASATRFFHRLRQSYKPPKRTIMKRFD